MATASKKTTPAETAAKAKGKTLDVNAAEKKLADQKAAEKKTQAEAAAKSKAAAADAVAKAKAEAKAKLDKERADKKAADEKSKAEKAKAREAEKEAANKEKGAKAAAAKAEQDKALGEIAKLQEAVDAAATKLADAKSKLNDAKRAARLPVAGTGSTASLRARAGSYVKDSEHKTEGGNVSVHCGDATAQKLLGKTLDECYTIAAGISEESEEDLRAKYEHLNVGMQRMNLGNKIRGVLNAK